MSSLKNKLTKTYMNNTKEPVKFFDQVFSADIRESNTDTGKAWHKLAEWLTVEQLLKLEDK